MFEKGNKLAKGQARGPGKYSEIKHKILEVFSDNEELINERFAKFLNGGDKNFKWLMEFIARTLPNNVELSNSDGEPFKLIISDKFLPKKKEKKKGGNGNGNGDSHD